MSNLATINNNLLADSGIDDLNVVVTTGSYSNPAWITALAWTKITGTPTTLSGYGITNAYTKTEVDNIVANYLPLAGGTMTGNINWAQTDRGIVWAFNTDGAYIKFYNTGDADTNSRLEFATLDNNDEFFRWVHIPSGGTLYELMRLKAISSGNSELIVNGKIIKSGGTSSQYLMADGSVSTLTNPVTGTGTTGTIPKWTSASAIGNSIISESSGVIEVNGNTRTLGTFISTSAGTERYIQMLGYNSSYATIRSNVGFNSSYNSLAFIVNTNATEGAQGNATIPSWQMVLGGSLPDTDSFYIQRSVAGSFTFSNLFKILGTGQIQFNNYTSSSSFTGTSAGILGFTSSGTVITLSPTLYPSGSGFNNYITKWTGANSIGNSQMFDDGTNVAIGVTSTITKLSIGSYTGARLPYIDGTTRTFNANGITVTSSNNANAAVGGGLDLTNNTYSVGAYSPILSFSSLSSSGAYNNAYAGIWGVLGGQGVDANWVVGSLVFGTASGAGINETMRIDSSGRLGVNTTSMDSRIVSSYGTLTTFDNTNIRTTTALLLTASDPGTTSSSHAVSLAFRPIINRGAAATLTVFNDSVNKEGGTIITFNSGGGGYPSSLTERFRIWSDGKVRFNQYGTGLFSGTVAYNLAVDSSGNIIETAGGVVDGSGTANYVPRWQDANTLTNSIIYDDGTNVGVGTASPVSKFQVQNGDIRLQSSGGDPSIIFGSFGISTSYPQGKIVLSDGGLYGGNFDFYTKDNGAATNPLNLVMSIKYDGRILINTSTGAGRLVIAQSNSVQPAILLPTDESTIQGPAANTQIRMGANLVLNGSNIATVGTAGSERIRVTSTGFVGINESAPGYRLQVTDSNQYVAGFINNVANQLATVLVANSAQSSAGVNTAAATFELVGKAGTSTHGRHAWIGSEGVASETFRTKLLFKIRGESNTGYTWSGASEAPTILSLDGNGLVGINTKNPEALFSIANTSGQLIHHVFSSTTLGANNTWYRVAQINNNLRADIELFISTVFGGAYGSTRVRISSLTRTIQAEWGNVNNGYAIRGVRLATQSGITYLEINSNETAPAVTITSSYIRGTNFTPLEFTSASGSTATDTFIFSNYSAFNGGSFVGTIGVSTGYNYSILTESTERIRVLGSGRILMNTTSDAGNYTLQVSGNSYTNGSIYTTSASTERHIQMLGYNSAYVTVRSNVGFNSNYNSLSFLVNTNETNNAQGNATLPSWFMDLGGSIPDNDSFYIQRSAPGSYSPTLLFKLSSGGAGTFTSTITATSATANNGSPYAGLFWSGNDSGAIWRGAIALQHNANTTISAGSSLGIVFSPLASTGSNFYGHAAIKAVRPNATANNQDTDLTFWTRTGASNSTVDSEKMRLVASGNFAIGNTSPLTRLHVNNAVSGAILPYINGTGLSYNNDGISVAGSNTNNTNIGNGLTLYNNVSSVGAYGPVVAWSSLASSGNYNSTYAFITGVYRGNGGDFNWAAGDIIFGTAQTYGAVERMRIKDSGYIGMGTDAPARFLTLNSGATENTLGLTSNNGVIIDMVGYGTGFTYPQARIRLLDAGFYGGILTFSTKANGAQANGLNEVLRLTNTQDVGICQTSPTTKLHVYDSTQDRFNIRIESTIANNANKYMGIGFAGESSNTKGAIFFQSYGNSYSRGKMIFALNNTADQSSATPSNAILTLEAGGNATFVSYVTATAYYESSDSRIKTLLDNNIDYSLISNVEARYYEKNGVQELGYFAQDFENILSSAVYKDDKGFLNLSYTQVHTAKIAALEARVKELESQLKNK